MFVPSVFDVVLYISFVGSNIRLESQFRLYYPRASHTVTREEKGPRPTPPTFNEANTSSGAVVCSRGVISNSNSAPSSMFASVVTQVSLCMRECRLCGRHINIV